VSGPLLFSGDLAVSPGRDDRDYEDDPAARRLHVTVNAFDRCQIVVHGDCDLSVFDDCRVTVAAPDCMPARLLETRR